MSPHKTLTAASFLLLTAWLILAPAQATGHHSSTLTDDVLRWKPLVEEIFPESDPYWILHLIQCESMGDPETRYKESWGQHSIGLMQVNEGWLTGWGEDAWRLVNHADPSQPVDLADPASNLQAVRWIRHYEDTRGKRPWSQWACTQMLAERGVHPPEFNAG